MKETPVRFAIVGTGSIADFHAAAISQVEGAGLVAVYSRGLEKARAFSERHGGRVHTSLSELLSDPEVDAVCITTPSGAHAGVAIAALQSGRHVLCEKPLDVTLEKVDAMLEAEARSGKILAAVFQSRLAPNARRLKAAVESGRFGRLTLCSCHIRWWRDQNYYDSVAWRGTKELDGGGCLMNQGIHGVDLLQWLVGKPEEVTAYTAALAHQQIEVEDTAVAALRFPGGTLGLIEAATSAWPGFQRRIELSGDKGSVILEDDVVKFWQFESELPEDEEIRASASAGGTFGSGASDPRAISTEGHRLLVEDLVGAIREGRPPAIPGSEGRAAIETILAIYRSADEGRPVRLG
jgi:UDP-N-acetyl-2-amino-2-deoxyglucuronate dehydrogenase